jgi:hypothetical protein
MESVSSKEIEMGNRRGLPQRERRPLSNVLAMSCKARLVIFP